MKPAETWTYPGGDSCVDFFTACLQASTIDLPSTAHVLEVGCGEFDWLTPASAAWPEMTFDGIDWRCKKPHPNPRVTRIQGNVLVSDQYPHETFDWVVAISTIEHIGLGHYAQDPLDSEGDVHALANIWRWLKPGGWLLFDVPFDPTGSRKIGTECRVYDQADIGRRLWTASLTQAHAPMGIRLAPDSTSVFASPHEGRAPAPDARWHQTWYCHANACTELVPLPAKPVQPFHYCGLLWQKVA